MHSNSILFIPKHSYNHFNELNQTFITKITEKMVPLSKEKGNENQLVRCKKTVSKPILDTQKQKRKARRVKWE